MLLLAADTSGKFGSIALAKCDVDDCKVIEIVPLTGGTFSAQLVPQIAGVLEKHRFNKLDLAGFAVASGPGSFTGLRVGLAALKALAEVLRKPIAAVSLLEAVAVVSRSSGRILAALDAGRNEAYVGEYESSSPLLAKTARSGVPPVMEKLISREELMQAAESRTIVTPDKEIVDLARSRGLASELIERPRSDAIARIGWRKIQAGETVSAEELEANYIRRSDAEIFARSGD